MNTGKSGGIGRAKHRQAFGHDIVSGHVKLDLQRQMNKLKTKKQKLKPEMKESIQELFSDHKGK